MARIAKWRRDTYWRWQDERQKRHGGGAGGGTPGVITANAGAFFINGNDAVLRVGRAPLVAAAGSFVITGNAATLTYSGAGAGTNFTAVRISHLQW